jgi:hypothetical protein
VGINNVIVFVRHVLSRYRYLYTAIETPQNLLPGRRLERYVMKKHASASYFDNIDDRLKYCTKK